MANKLIWKKYITPKKLLKPKGLAENCHIEFYENPIADGVILTNNKDSKDELNNVIEEIPRNYHFENSGLIFLTLEEWKKTKEIKGLRLAQKIGAIYSIKPSLSFLISRFYRKLEISQFSNRIKITGELHQNIYELFEKHFGLTKHENCLTFTFQDAENLKQKVDNLNVKEITFPNPQENCLYFKYNYPFYEAHKSDLSFEVSRLKRVLKKYFPDNPFVFSYSTDYTFDIKKLDKGLDELERMGDIFWNKMFEIHGDDFLISRTHRTISFDFETEEELNQKLNFIKSFPLFDIHDRGENHKFKFNYQVETNLHELQVNLTPSLS